MIKIKNLFRTLCATFVTAALFFGIAGCSNLFENLKNESSSNDSESGKAYISLSLANNARTILPSKIDFEKDSGLIFCLVGKCGSETNIFGYWEDEEELKAYDIMTSDVVAIEPGEWTFRLSVLRKETDESTGKEALYGELTQTITAGANTLPFGELKIPDGSTSSANILNYDVAGGSISLSLSFPGGKADSAKATLYGIDGTEQTVATASLNFNAGSSSENGSVLYKATQINAGDYILKIIIMDKNESVMGAYPELVTVEPGAESAAERTLEDLNKIYIVKYEHNGSGGSEIPSWLVSELDGSINLLSDISSYYTPDEYDLAGWTKVKGSTTAQYEPGEKVAINSDTTFYAVWKLHEFSITYELRDENASLPENAVTKFTKEDSLALPVPTTTTNSNGVAMKFVGWYDRKQSGDYYYIDRYPKIEEGTKKDLTLYARWGAEDEVEYQAYCIRNLLNEDNTTIYIKGDMTKYQTADLGESIKNGSHFLKLDLSQTTITTFYGLTNTSSSSYMNNDNNYLTEIILPDTLTEIGEYALHRCRNLKTVKIPDTVTTIGRQAFDQTGLTSITIPESVTSIGSGAFEICRDLTSITIPKNVTSIGDFAFYYCDGLTSITISENVTKIGRNVFDYCSGLTSITIPENVTSIGESAFENCTGLTSITIPEKVTEIDKSAFENCTGLTSITIPEKVTEIDKSAFENCTKLTNVEFKATDGWSARVDSWSSSEASSIDATELADKAKAATYLTETYKDRYWRRTTSE